MTISFNVTYADKTVSTITIPTEDGGVQTSTMTVFGCEFDDAGIQTWNGDIPVNEPILTPTSELLQRLIDIYGQSLVGKTIVIDLEDANGNIVRLT